MAYAISSVPGNDLAMELAAYLDKSLNTSTAVPKTKEELTANRIPSALSSIIAQSASLWENASDKDLEAFYALLGQLLLTLGEKHGSEQREALIKLLSSSAARGVARLAVLNHLYNIGKEGVWKVSFFEAIIKTAIMTKQSDLVLPTLQDLERLYQVWGVSEVEKQRISYALHQVLAEVDQWLSYVYLAKWIESFKSEADAAAKVDDLAEGITSTLSRADVFQYQSLAQSAAASAVAKKNTDLIKLLNIFHNGNYQDFVALCKAAPALFSGTLNVDACATKIRILTLVSLAYQQTSIPYQTIATALEVSLDDVEAWVLDTIAEGLIEAKLDHLSSSVFVSYALRRDFAKQQWNELNDKLGKWISNIDGMLGVIRDARSQGREHQTAALKSALVGH